MMVKKIFVTLMMALALATAAFAEKMELPVEAVETVVAEFENSTFDAEAMENALAAGETYSFVGYIVDEAAIMENLANGSNTIEEVPYKEINCTVTSECFTVEY